MSSLIALKELFKAGFEDFVVPSYESAPFTTIQNRARVTRSLKAVAGIERIHLRSVNLLHNEFGSNGERVFEADNKDTRIRFVGTGWYAPSDANGGYIISGANLTDYCEVVFYGTGLNILAVLNSSTYNSVVSIDGGTEGSNIYASYSGVLAARNTKSNQILNVASGLTLGWHTVKIRNNTASNSTSLYGFEILNQRTDLAVYSGAGISQGSFTGLSSLSTSSFTENITGTKGARVVKYIEDGSLKSAVREVDATAKYLTLADHTNEEVLRRINFREFGANRADDFSTLALVGSNRNFTLDDGSTVLIGQNVTTATHSSGVVGVRQGNVSDFYTITFVGTGLDIFGMTETGSPQTGNIEVTIDGGTVNTFSETVTTGTQNNPHYVKICSGLSYGTHTVKLARPSGSGVVFATSDFIIYQPKKPSIPAGAFEVADYNVMASFSPRINAAQNFIATGILRKQSGREFAYVGTWGINTPVPTADSGDVVSGNTSGNSLTYTFFGTGFEWRNHILTNTQAINLTFSVNGSTNLSAYTTETVATATNSFTASTGVFTATGNGAPGIVRVRNMPLGLYTVRILSNNASTIYSDCLDIITPIHINHPSLKIGSQSLKSETKFSPEKSVSNAGPDLSKAKAWLNYDMAGNRIVSSFNISAVVRGGTGQNYIFFEKQFKNANYVAAGACQSDVVGSFVLDATGGLYRDTGRVLIQCLGHDGVYRNQPFTVAFFGELIDE